MYFEKLKELLKNQDFLRVAIILILLITFVRGVIYATVFPLWQAPDEPVQFERVDFYARKYLPLEKNRKYKNNDNLIIEKVDKEILNSWYNLKSWEYISWDSAKNWFKSGERYKRISDTYMGNIFYEVLYPGYPASSLFFYSPVYFTDVQVRAYAVRFFSVILRVLVVYLGYKTAKELFPDDLLVVLGTPLFITFVPAFTHMSSAINPDNLANLGASLFIFYSVKILKKFSLLSLLMLILSVFMGLITKGTTFFTVIMLLLIPAFMLIRTRSDRFKAAYKRYGAIFIYCALALLSGFYIASLIGNRLGFYTFDLAAVVAIKSSTVNYFKTTPISEFVNKIKRFSNSFWLSFAWGEVRVNKSTYSILWNFTFIPLIGLFLIPIKRIFSKRRLLSKYQLTSIIYLAILFIIAFSIILIKQLVISKTDMTGRYIYTVIIPIAIFTTLGLSQLFKNKKVLLLIMFPILFLFDASTLLIYIIPFFYKTPQTYNLSFLYPLATLFNKPFILNSIYFYIFIFFVYFSLIGYLAYNLLLTKNIQIQGVKQGTGG